MIPPDALANCRVLFIEDEYFIGDDLEKTLSRFGAHVIGPIGTLEEALSQVAKDRFQAAVLDLNLHKEKAFPVADELRRQNVPFVITTGYSDESIPARFQDVERWEKPYDALHIVSSIARICREPNSLAAAKQG